jgi:hypothetical protein
LDAMKKLKKKEEERREYSRELSFEEVGEW